MNLRSRRRIAQIIVSQLPERRRSPHSLEDGRVIAEATGTRYKPVDAPKPEQGGGIVYGFVQRTPEPRDTGQYGRLPQADR